ncbi:MAG: TetR/AcrR family transcriptional regulator [Ktedonobacterales bacterium]|nr:TetR/AcrR family transcriptional regulator [Ktedonobacterales bacterium]
MAKDPQTVTTNAAKITAIFEGAMQEFLQHGYEGSSMDRVAAQANVAKATIYAHFDDKEALFSALIRQLVEQKFQQLFVPALTNGTAVTSSAQLQSFFSRILAGLAADEQFLGFIRLIIGESGRFPHLAQAFVAQLDQPLLTMLAHYLAPLRLADPEATAHIISGTLLSTIIIGHILHGATLIGIDDERLMGVLAEQVFLHKDGSTTISSG